MRVKVFAEASLSATTSSYDLRQADMDKIDGKINHSCENMQVVALWMQLSHAFL